MPHWKATNSTSYRAVRGRSLHALNSPLALRTNLGSFLARVHPSVVAQFWQVPQMQHENKIRKDHLGGPRNAGFCAPGHELLQDEIDLGWT